MYRLEIDGLRAFSVVLVILFHLQIVHFEGGFIGVDVFLVISGYLITAIIVENMRLGQFTFGDFYLRRITRIIPALLATIVLGLAVSIALMTPNDLVYAAKQGLAAVFSVSNIFFWLEADYWDPNSRYKVFLHTWSLGVEEQFYLLYPLMLWLAFRLGGRNGIITLLLLMLIGGTLASELWLHSSNPAVSFYLTPLRFYEFALGGLGSLLIVGPALPGRWARFGEAATLLGLAMIAGSAVLLTKSSNFPGLNALPAALGALLIILAGATRTAVLLLRNRPVVWIGKASFSIYLAHWPIIVLYRYHSGPNFTVWEMLGLVLATLLVATLIHYAVERPMRLAHRQSATLKNPVLPPRLAGMAATVLLICGTAYAILSGQGWPSRVADTVQYLAERSVRDPWSEKLKIWNDHCKPNRGALCGDRKPGVTNIILLADSRGPDIYVALRAAYPEAHIRASYKMGCPPVFDVQVATNPRFPNCVELNKERLAAALDAPAGDIVFLAMNFNWLRARAAMETSAKLVAAGKRVYVIGETRFISEQNPLSIAVQHGAVSNLSEVIVEHLVDRPFGMDEDFADRIEAAGATFVHNRDFFYDGRYRLYTRDGSDLLMYDRFHFTVPGALEYGDYLRTRYPLAK